MPIWCMKYCNNPLPGACISVRVHSGQDIYIAKVSGAEKDWYMVLFKVLQLIHLDVLVKPVLLMSIFY